MPFVYLSFFFLSIFRVKESSEGVAITSVASFSSGGEFIWWLACSSFFWSHSFGLRNVKMKRNTTNRITDTNYLGLSAHF